MMSSNGIVPPRFAIIARAGDVGRLDLGFLRLAVSQVQNPNFFWKLPWTTLMSRASEEANFPAA
jgi:hypothetical protein